MLYELRTGPAPVGAYQGEGWLGQALVEEEREEEGREEEGREEEGREREVGEREGREREKGWPEMEQAGRQLQPEPGPGQMRRQLPCPRSGPWPGQLQGTQEGTCVICVSGAAGDAMHIQPADVVVLDIVLDTTWWTQTVIRAMIVQAFR
jgi:hypothetical protein